MCSPASGGYQWSRRPHRWPGVEGRPAAAVGALLRFSCGEPSDRILPGRRPADFAARFRHDTAMTTPDQLRDRLRKVEALFAGAGTAGERLAAEAALERIRAK